MAQQPMLGQMPMMPPQMGQPLQAQNQSQLRPCIYVGDLEENINEQMLFNFFSKYGQIYAVKVMRDKYNKKSRGFAFVQFWQPKEAETAIKLANHEKILKNSIRVCWKKNIRDFSNEANVYVKNLDKLVTIKEIDSLFSQYGTILSSKLSLDEQGNSLGYGYIQFANKEQAEKCINEANNKLRIQNKVVEVLPFQQKKTRPDARTNLYIKNLPNTKSQIELTEDIKNVFGQYGEITSLKVTKHEGTQQFYAFVCYKENTAADKAYKELQDANPFSSENKLYINWHEDKRSRQSNLKQFYSNSVNETNLFTKNLKADVTTEKLKELFQKYFGEITSCVIRQPPEVKQQPQQQQVTTSTEQQQQQQQQSEEEQQKQTTVEEQKQQQSGSSNLPPQQQPKVFVKTQFGYINFKTKDSARDALGKFKNFEDITALYQDGKSFLNYHIKRDQFQKFKQTNSRNKEQGMFGFLQGVDQAGQQMMLQRIAQMQMLYMMQQQMFFAQMQAYNMGGMPNQNMRPQMGGYGNLPSYQNRGPQNNRPNQRQQNKPYQKKGGRPNQRHYNNKRGQQIQYQQKSVQQQQPADGAQAQGNQQNAAGQLSQQQQQQNSQLPQVFQLQGLTIQTLKDNMQEFLKLNQEKQRTLLGELIFPSVSKYSTSEEIAPKITGMLIDLEVFEVTDILEFLENEQQLQERIREAEELIKQESSAQQ